ncbi:MAG: molybdate ABC transporter permease subunit [Pigmentiphaga sp.]|nr:molybdate ABC transporter permease subunit [Pigmentiphaga sp.]
MSGVATPLLLSLKVALWATFFATVFGVAIAYWLSRKQSTWFDLIDSILTLPMVLPPTVIGYYLLVLFGRRGWLGPFLADFGIELVFTWQGAVVAATVVAFPMVLKAARAAFQTVDRQYQDAGRVMGISELGLFFRVTLPLASRGILAGVLLAFARALGEFGATLMIAGNIPGRTQTLSIAIYEAVQAGNDSMANTLVMITSITCVTVLWVSSHLLQAEDRRRKRGEISA